MTSTSMEIVRWCPKKLADFAGNPRLRRVLRGMLRNDAEGANLMLTGDYGSCKSQAARFYLKAVQCQNINRLQDGPCLRCDNCNSVDLRDGNAGLFSLQRESTARGMLQFHTVVIDCARVNLDELFQRVCDLEHFHGRRIILLDEVHHLGRNNYDEKLAVTMDSVDAVWIGCTANPDALSTSFKRRFPVRTTLVAPSLPETIEFLEARCSEFGIEVELPDLLRQVAVRTDQSISECLNFLSEVALAFDGKLSMESIHSYDFRQN